MNFIKLTLHGLLFMEPRWHSVEISLSYSHFHLIRFKSPQTFEPD